jgi:predicted  nucleic acid-binding Zn-ribbon protein
MQKYLAILFLAILHSTLSFDLAAYKQQYQTQVGVPYKTAVTIVATDIIEYLAITPVPTTAQAGRDIVADLNAKAQVLSSNLGIASRSSDALRQQLDKEVENLVSQGSAVEKQLASNEQQLQATNSQIQQTNTQLVTAQNQVNQAQQAVNNAINNLNNEQSKVDHAKNHCTFIGGWFGKKLCSAVNHGGIDAAEHDRDGAQNQLNSEQQRLNGLRTTQTQLTQKQASLQQTKTNLQNQKNNLNVQLAQLNQARDNVNNIDTALKALIAHVGTLFGTSQVLADVVKNLIDMETVIKPLTAIADQIISYTPNAADVAYLNVMKQKISASLPLVQQKLPQYALIPKT